MSETMSASRFVKPLALNWDALKKEQPKLRIRDAAKQLEVSELELLLTRLGNGVTLLTNDHGSLLIDLEKVGRVMALSRNDQVVHERHGTYTDFKVNKAGNMGLCLGEIDLRTFLNHWHIALWVKEHNQELTRESIQFFDKTGMAVHKVYATQKTNTDAWNELVREYVDVSQEVSFVPEQKKTTLYPNAGQLDQSDVETPWSALKDVHHFHSMLAKLQIDRIEALELVGKKYAERLSSNAIEVLLQRSSANKLPLMVFVGNGGIVQIHTGPVEKLLRTGPWFNVLDQDFNLHANTEQIDQIWIARRPTTDGIVTSVECYNAERELVLTFFGARKPGQAESIDWRHLAEELERSE